MTSLSAGTKILRSAQYDRRGGEAGHVTQAIIAAQPPPQPSQPQAASNLRTFSTFGAEGAVNLSH